MLIQFVAHYLKEMLSSTVPSLVTSVPGKLYSNHLKFINVGSRENKCGICERRQKERAMNHIFDQLVYATQIIIQVNDATFCIEGKQLQGSEGRRKGRKEGDKND